MNARPPIRACLLALALLGAQPLARADIYLCVDAGGRRELTDIGRPGCKMLDVPSSIAAPPARRAGPASRQGAAPPVTPQAFPRVDSAQQRERDANRRAILESELRTEDGKLAELRKEFNNGEPERHGNEKNYVKYQERVSQMRDSIGRTEKNIEALKREIANMK